MAVNSSGIIHKNNWDNYQNQINSYLSSIQTNPYLSELRQDFKLMNIEKIIKYFSDIKYKTWISKLLKSKTLDTNEIINRINSNFTNCEYMKQICLYIEQNIKLYDEESYLKSVSLEF